MPKRAVINPGICGCSMDWVLHGLGAPWTECSMDWVLHGLVAPWTEVYVGGAGLSTRHRAYRAQQMATAFCKLFRCLLMVQCCKGKNATLANQCSKLFKNLEQERIRAGD